MNLRTTAWLFALMFSMLWLFGLMLAFKKNPLDKAYVVPTLQAAREVTVDAIVVQRKPEKKEPQEFRFEQENKVWRLKDPSGLSVRLEGFRVDQIVSQIKGARKDDEADVSNNPGRYGLDTPRATVILKGRVKGRGAAEEPDKDNDKEDKKAEQPAGAEKEREWRFYIGNDSPDKRYVYVNSSDEPERVFGVLKSNLDALFFEDPNHLRSKRLFEFSDVSAQAIDLKRGALELELKRGEGTEWTFVKPSLGLADFEGPPAPKDLPPVAKAPEGGVKGLLNAILNVRVDADSDFVPLAKDNLTRYSLEEGKAKLRIAVGSGDKKETNRETLLVGEQERGYYYARLSNDEGVFKLPEKQLEPILSALKEPGSLRSIDVTLIDPKQVDAVVLKQGSEETGLWHPEGKPWQIQAGSAGPKKANDAAVTRLLETLQGKRQIQRFHDDADAKKLDTELSLDKPALEITVYTGGLQKKEERKDEKKDAKADEKKEEKKDAKKDEGFALQKDAKPAVTLKFGKAGKETVPVLRVAADGITTRFEVPKSLFEVAAPPEGPLAFLDPALPSFEPTDVKRLLLERGGKKVELEKGTGNQAERWVVKESEDVAGQNLGDPARVNQLFSILGNLQARKWVKRLDAKDSLEEHGLKAPVLTATIQMQRTTPAGAASALGALSAPLELRGIVAAAVFAANQQADKGQAVTIKFGKENADKEVYAQHSGSDLLFVVPADLVRMLQEVDLRDRTMLLATAPVLGTGLVGPAAGLSLAGITAISPLATRTITDVDPDKVKELRLAVRTPFELRHFAFARKDKSWVDQSGLMEFTLDTDKVQKFVENMSRFTADRWISLGGGIKTDQKLDAKSFTIKIELVTQDGRTATITVGAPFERWGYFGHASTWPDSVFLVDSSRVAPLLSGLGWFAKQRVALGP